MPSDDYLNTFERNPMAAQVRNHSHADLQTRIIHTFPCPPPTQALFWAETHNWTFAKWRDKKFDALDALEPPERLNLITAMRDYPR